MYQELPLCTAGSPLAATATDYTARLAAKLQELQREKAGAILQSAAQRCRERGVTCDALPETGRLVHIMLAQEEHADLVVVPGSA